MFSEEPNRKGSFRSCCEEGYPSCSRFIVYEEQKNGNYFLVGGGWPWGPARCLPPATPLPLHLQGAGSEASEEIGSLLRMRPKVPLPVAEIHSKYIYLGLNFSLGG